MRSDFGKGFTYCLGMFLAHMAEPDYKSSLYCAADHLFELTIPRRASKPLKQRIKAFRDKAFDWRLPIDFSPTKQEEKDVATELYAEAKSILMAWDKECGIAVKEAAYK